MCEPATLGIVLSAGSSIMQGMSAQSAANANAQAALQNAERAREQANMVEDKKARELTALHDRRRQVMGEQRVAGAANGLNMQSGSGLNLLQSTAEEAQKDENNTLWNSELEKWGYNAQATEYENQASQFKAQGSNAMTMGIIGAATSVIGGLGDKGGGGASGGGSNAGINTGFHDNFMTNSGTYGTVNLQKWKMAKNPATYATYGFGR